MTQPGSRQRTDGTQLSPRRIGPGEFQQADWSRVSVSVRKAIFDAVQSEAFPVLLSGQPGVGKSYAMAAMYRIVKGQPVWWSATEFVRTIQACRRDGSVLLSGATVETSESNVWRVRVDNASCLFLDDFGVRAPSESAYEILYELIDRRGRKPFVISTNLTPADIQKSYGPRIYSRIMRGTVVESGGGDRRADGRSLVEVQF